jgi:isoquinoline 1-oxidoreductase beta subunit
MLHYLNQHFRPAPLPSAGRVVIENVSRRAFLKGSAAGAGLVVAMQVFPSGPAGAFETYDHGGHAMPHGVVNDPHIFVSIDPDGTVTIVAHRSEMGTGARTSLPMVIADEMEADWARVKIVQAEGDEPKYGNQDTDGSRSMRHHIQPCRQIGAAVRYMLRQAAAEQWGVEIAEVEAVNHEVIHQGSGQRAGYGDVAEAAMALEAPAPDIAGDLAAEPLPYKTEAEFRYIGKGEVQIYDLHDITTGAAVYGADVSLPGMKYAVIARPPVVGGKVKSVDDSAALAVQGVEQVVQLEGHIMPAKFLPLGGVAVIAANTHAAITGREALQIEWEDGPHAS